MLLSLPGSVLDLTRCEPTPFHGLLTPQGEIFGEATVIMSDPRANRDEINLHLDELALMWDRDIRGHLHEAGAGDTEDIRSLCEFTGAEEPVCGRWNFQLGLSAIHQFHLGPGERDSQISVADTPGDYPRMLLLGE